MAEDDASCPAVCYAYFAPGHAACPLCMARFSCRSALRAMNHALNLGLNMSIKIYKYRRNVSYQESDFLSCNCSTKQEKLPISAG